MTPTSPFSMPSPPGARRLATDWRALLVAGMVASYLIIPAVVSANAPADFVRSDTVHVIDGQTLSVAGQSIRLWGITTAPLTTTAGKGAAFRAGLIIAGEELTCHPMGKDTYGSTIARCDLSDGRDVACEMVRAGMAEDWPMFSGGAYADCRDG